MDNLSYFTHSELVRLLDLARKKDYIVYCCYYLAFIYGMRVSEVIGLRGYDLNIEEKTIFIRRLKGSVSTSMRATPEVIQIFAKNKKRLPSQRLFNISRSTLDLRIKDHCRRLKIPRKKAHFHTLKHTTAMFLLNKGTDVRTIQKILGHKQISNTLLYLNVSGKHLEAETLSLDEILSTGI